MIYPTTVLLAQLTDDMAFHTGAQSYFQKWLCRCDPARSWLCHCARPSEAQQAKPAPQLAEPCSR